MCRRVLLIEDEEHIRETLQVLLTNAGYLVTATANGKNIFDLIEEFNPSLILLDILLDEMDGREICRAVKSTPSTASIPIIILSAVQDLYNTIIDFGANDVVAKPFDERTLLNRIERQLSNSNAVSWSLRTLSYQP